MSESLLKPEQIGHAASGFIMVSNGTRFVAQAPGVGLKSVQVFLADGTWTRPAGVTMVVVEVQAAGGGGGGCEGTGGVCAGGGGGAGGYAIKLITSPGATEGVFIGVVGTGGAAGNNAGTGAVVSSFGVHILVGGGEGGAGATFGSGVAWALGGAGGFVASGTYSIAGAPGGVGMFAITKVLATYDCVSGAGGSGRFGGGALPVQNSDGVAGGQYGGGGSGGADIGSTDRAGGDGGPGIVVVWEYGA